MEVALILSIIGLVLAIVALILGIVALVKKQDKLTDKEISYLQKAAGESTDNKSSYRRY